jgi:predicted DNA-binding transcriptional regulator AlpA
MPKPTTDDRLVSRAEIAALYSVSPMTVFAWSKAGKLPPPVRLGRRCVRYRLADVRRLLESTELAQ